MRYRSGSPGAGIGRRAARLTLFAALLLAPVAAWALDPKVALSQYGHREWGVENGLPESAVQAIAQTRDGYLWLGTQEGLARFDGLHFTIFTRANTLALDKAFITSLSGDGGSGLWIGTQSGGLVHYDGERFSLDPSLTALNAHTIHAMAPAPDHSLWVTTNAGIIRRTADGKAAIIPVDRSMADVQTTAVLVTRTGHVWAGTSDGLAELRGGRLCRFVPASHPRMNVLALAEDAAGQLWIGTDHGLYRKEGEEIRPFKTVESLSHAYIGALAEDSDRNLWIGSSLGIVRLTADRAVSISEEAGTEGSQAVVMAFFEDRERTMWIGTFSGLRQLRDTPVKPVGRAEGMRAEMVMSVLEDPSGDIWAGTSGGLAHLEKGSVGWIGAAEGLASTMLFAISNARDGGIWAGTLGGGVCHIKGGRATCYDQKAGLSLNSAATAVEDSEGGLWIGTLGGGLDYMRDGRVTVYGKSSGLPSLRIIALRRARAGGLWVGMSEGGLVYFADGRVQRVIPISARPENVTVRGVLEDADGTLWIAADEHGFYRWRGGHVMSFPLARFGLEGIGAVEDDGHGSLWITSNHGIARLSRSDLEAFAGGRSSVLHPEMFDAGSGMPSAECNGNILRASDGRLWFATTKGLAFVDPLRLRGERPPMRAVIERFEVDGKAVPVSGGAVPALPKTGRIVVHFTAPALNEPERIRFRYRMEGFDAKWIDADASRTAVYTNLPPGRHQFRVIASTPEEAWSEERFTALEFERLPSFRETVQFQLLCAALLMAAIWGIFKLRTRVHRRRESQLVQRVDAQTAQLRETNAQLTEAKERAELAAMVHAQLSRNSRTILNSIGEGILGLDEGGNLTFMNIAGANMLGWDAETLAGRALHPLIHCDDGSHERTEEACPVCSRSMPVTAREGSTTFRRSDGSNFPVEFTASSMLSDDGTSTRVVIAFRDITERRAVEQMKSEFVSTVSHELRTPLTSIRGALGLLASGVLGIVSTRGQRMLDVAVINTDRLVRLINDILDLERIDSGGLQLKRGLVHSRDLMIQAVEGVQAMADQAGVSLSIRAADTELWVDSDRIIQTLVNLLSNAIKFSPPETEIVVTGTTGAETFKYCVTDRGRGIPADRLETIFERFRQVDASDSRGKGGTGLGLAISRSIVQAHGGQIWAEADPEGGSIFQFTLPLHMAGAEDASCSAGNIATDVDTAPAVG